MNSSKNISLIAFIAIVIAAIASRFIPHPFNFTAVGAVALFAGYVMRDKRYAYFIPLAILVVTDVIIGFHFSMVPVYGCFMFTVWMGTVIRNKKGLLPILLGSVISSIVFFLVTNLPFWYLDIQLYPMTLSGTLQSYTMAIPFFKNQLLGDMFYNLVLFGSYFMMLERGKVNPVVVKK